MSIYVVAIHMNGGTGHEHVASMIWVNESTMQSGISTTAIMVDFIDKNNAVKVSDGTTRVAVGVWRESGKIPYLRTYADNKWTDNLLSLPRF